MTRGLTIAQQRALQISGRSLVRGDIPDDIVSRPDDDGTGSVSGETGLEIETKTEWPSLGAIISIETSGVTDAYLRADDGSLINNLDISGLSAGDAFIFNDVNLKANTKYRITVDAGNSTFTQGFSNNATNYPYESSYITITSRIRDGGAPDETGEANCVNYIGNVGFA